MNNKAFSLVEVTVAAVIFSAAMAGVFASLGAIKRPAAQTDNSLKAAYCGQQVLQTFRANVDSRDWDEPSSNLAVGDHTIDSTTTPSITSFSACGAGTGVTSVDYTVTAADNGTRRVELTVNFS